MRSKSWNTGGETEQHYHSSSSGGIRCDREVFPWSIRMWFLGVLAVNRSLT